MLHIEPTSRYRKDRKLMKKQGRDLSLLDDIIKKLQKREPLHAKHRDHQLTGNYAKFRECHITPDWLLMYVVDNDRLILVLSRTGTHSELFR